MKNTSSSHNSIMHFHHKMERMKCIRFLRLHKEIQGQEELVLLSVKIKIREGIEEGTDNKINNLAVERTEEKEWGQIKSEDLTEIIDRVDKLSPVELVEVVHLKLFQLSRLNRILETKENKTLIRTLIL